MENFNKQHKKKSRTGRSPENGVDFQEYKENMVHEQIEIDALIADCCLNDFDIKAILG